MADQHTHPNLAVLRKLEASLHLDLLERDVSAYPEEPSAGHCSVRQLLGRDYRWFCLVHLWWYRLRTTVYVAGSVGAVVLMGLFALWWRLGSGPIEFDIATPWLTAAIEENLGSQHHVEVGGTQIERDANGRTAIRIRDIVVRDSDGAIVASAPKAEVGVSSTGLVMGRVRAERLSLVGAEMQIRIEPDSKVTVFAGSNKRPFVTASAAEIPVRTGAMLPQNLGRQPASQLVAAPAAPAAPRNVVPEFSALLAWIDGLSASGLDGRDLSEIGLKNGNLTVDDQRNGKQWTFEDINLSVTRPKVGSIVVTISSEAAERPWKLRAAITQGERGYRTVEIETQKLSAKDLMLAMRLGDGQYEAELPVSARIRASIGPDGIPEMVDGRILVDQGFIVDLDDQSKIAIDRAEFTLDWDAMRRALVVPFQIVSGGNRITLFAQVDAPREPGGIWNMKVNGGTVVLALAANDPTPLIINRFLVKLRFDPEKRRIDLEQGDIGNMEVGVALSGSLDLQGEPRLEVGVAGTRMSVGAMKRLWPAFVNPKVRDWVEQHLQGGTVERLVIAANSPFANLRASGPPLADDALAIEISGTGAEIRAIEGLPSIRDADMSVRITGRTATVNVGRGNVELSPNRKLAVTNGVFEVPDMHLSPPPARVRFRLDGPVQAAAELLASERLREFSGAPVDPATSRGTLSAQVNFAMPLRPDLPPGSAQYAINMDVANFAADKMVMGQKIEATTLRVNANNQGYHIKGDVKINGVAAALDYRKPRGDADAEVRLAATLDDAARNRLGIDLSAFVSGPIPVKVSGKIPANENDGRFGIEADLTQARIDKLLPGWIKPPGRAARMTFTASDKGPITRFDDVVIESPGTLVKGTIELNDARDIVSVNFPVFQLADGDKALLKAERGPDGALRVMMRGDVYDGRGFIKSSMAGPSTDQVKQQMKDIDLDIRFGTLIGFHGETLRGVDLRMSRRGGAIKSFTLNAKLGRDSPLSGDLRGRAGGRNVVYVESGDAGAFFRFTDMYPKIFGGEMWVAMDPPAADPFAAQDGILNIRDFAVRGEAALDRVAAGGGDVNGPNGSNPHNKPGVDFSRMRVEFTRTLGRFSIREGIVKGPMIGATTEGYIDYMKNDVHMRGTFVPFYGLNNMFGQIPLFGIFLGGGSNEGLVGLTYEVAGPPSAPVLRVNPISVVAPGMIRKFFEFPTTGARSQSYADPSR